MKRILHFSFFLFLLGAFMAPQVMAQRGGNFSPEQMKERRVQQMKDVLKQLDLTEAEADTSRKIIMVGIDEQMALMKDARGSGQGGFQQMREKMRAIDEETVAKLANVLPEEKLNKYKEIMQEQRNRRPGGGRRGGNGG